MIKSCTYHIIVIISSGATLFLPLKNSRAMTTAELQSRIYCWLWLYDHVPFPTSQDPKIRRFTDVVSRQWTKEMLIDVTDMHVPMELQLTSAGNDLQAAIAQSQTGDLKNAPLIRALLIRVQQYIDAIKKNHSVQSYN